LAFAGSINSTQVVNLDGGTLTVSNITHSGNNPTKNFNFNGGTLTAAGNFTLGTMTAVNVVNGANINTNGNDVVIADALLNAGSGGLTKIGTGIFTLGGSNSYLGATQVLAGSLVTSAADVLPNSTALTVASGATLTMGDNGSVATLLLNGALQGSGTLTAASYALNGGSANSALGAGVLTSTGSSSLGATSAATTVVVSSGTLTLMAANLLADGAAVSVASGATLALSGSDSVASLGLAGIQASSRWARPHVRSRNGWVSLTPKPTYYRVAPAAPSTEMQVDVIGVKAWRER
jgi:autotransporter-associated beta strand protein